MSQIITLKRYDYQKNEEVIETAEITTHLIARNIDAEQLAEIIDNYLNGSMSRDDAGLKVGQSLLGTHPTLQRLAVVFALGIICGLAEKERTDGRNEDAIATAKKIKSMMNNGELPIGLYR